MIATGRSLFCHAFGSVGAVATSRFRLRMTRTCAV